MFSEAYNGEIRQYFDRQMKLLYDRREVLAQEEEKLPEGDRQLWRFSRRLLEQKTREITDVLAGCTEDEGQALRFLYSAMPLSDMIDYPAALYLAYAKHGVFLWREGAFAGRVPEKLFANYVLHHRVHNEDIADTRSFFHGKLKERIKGKSMYDAAVEINFWCAEKATYQSTFPRTQNPLTMYRTAIGRCGEEAPFAATALRSMGIPAREVAAPWWAHCDDNHAWIEAWCDGEWHFLGACEPEESLDRGWFRRPASRGMLIESRWFGKDAPMEAVVGRSGMATKLNHLGQYADTLRLKVRAVDEAGTPVPGARVDFDLLNYGKFSSVASLVTCQDPDSGEYGTAGMETGRGDLLVCAYKDGLYGETHVSLGKTGHGQGLSEAECTVVLKSGFQGPEEWRDMDFHAPGGSLYDERKTDEQSAAEEAKLGAAAASRQRRREGFYDREAAERVLMRFSGEDREALDRILHQARGNMGEIVRFLEWDFGGRAAELVDQYGQEGWKLEALRTLRENDCWDIRAEVLAECCVSAAPYAAEFPREVFFQSLLNPCALFEKPRACRQALADALGKSRAEMVRLNPQSLAGILEKLLKSMPEQEYSSLVTSPVGCLTGGIGSQLSRAVLYIQTYRALGVPARMRFMDRTIEYYKDGGFVPVSLGGEQGVGQTGRLILRPGASLGLEDWKRYSLSRFEEGRFMPLHIRRGMKKGQAEEKAGQMELDLAPGVYRLVTTDRLPDGDQMVRIYDFGLKAGETKEAELAGRDIPAEALLNRRSVEDVALFGPGGEETSLAAAGGSGRSLFLWLDPSKEPTEHILDELCERKERFGSLRIPVYFVVRRGTDPAADGALNRACRALPQARILLEDFGEAYGRLSYQAGQNPGKLPFAMVLEDGRESVYSDAGYNVGMADILLRILE